MKILTTQTEKNWVDISSTPTTVTATTSTAPGTPAIPTTPVVPTAPILNDKLEKQKKGFEDKLIEILLTDNLVILTGLGPSLSVLNSTGARIAPTMQNLWDSAKSKSGTDFAKILTDVKYSTLPTGDNIELLLTNCLTSENFESKANVKKFIDETIEVIREKCDFLNTTPPVELNIHETFLRRVGRRPTKKPRLKLFTTNYDLCFESAANNINFTLIDGFSFSLPPKFDTSYFDYDIVRRDHEKDTQDFIPNALYLFKMHGSINWDGDNDKIVKKEKPVIPLMIYPMNSKYELSFGQPFLEMMSRFQSLIRKPNTALVTIGFGFNDNHISEPILSAIKSNISLKYLHVSLGLDGSTNTYISKIGDLIKEGDSRLQMLEGNFQEFTELLPDIAKESEEDVFLKRIKKI